MPKTNKSISFLKSKKTNIMAKYELVKETRIDGVIQYSIEIDGRYVSRSVTYNLEQAEEYLRILTEKGSLETIRETIKTIEVND
jgi:hypothetical protein